MVHPDFMKCVPMAFPELEKDHKARGVRDKPALYRNYLSKWLGETVQAFAWGVDNILPALPLYIIEAWCQSAGWAALIRCNSEYHIVSGINAAFDGHYNEWYMYEGINVTSSYAPQINGHYTFGENAVLLRNDTFMRGMYPLFCPKAELAVETDVSILCGVQNLRIINIIHAANDKLKLAAESFLKQIRWGRSGIITGSNKTWSGDDSKTLENLPTGGVPANYMQQLIETAQYIRGSLYNEIGLQSNYNMKREKLSDSEVNANNDSLRPLIDNMFECRKNFCEEVKKVFGVSISVELAGAWKTRAEMAEKAAEETAPQEAHEDEPEGGEDENADAQ